MKKRALIVLGCVLALLLLTPLATLYFLAYTEAGLHFIAGQSGQYGRVTVRIEGAEGTLARGFHIRMIDVDHARSHSRYEDVRGRIAIAPLFVQTLRVARLRIDTALIEVRARTIVPTGPRRAIRFLPRFLTINTDDVQARLATLVIPSGGRYDFTALRTSGVLHSTLIRVFDSQFNLPNLHVQTSGDITAGDPIGLEGKLRLVVQIPNQPRWVANSQFHGDLDALPLTGSVTEPLRAQVQGKLEDLVAGWHFAGSSKLQQLDLRVFGAGNALGEISGDLTIQASRGGYKAQGMLTPAGLEAGALRVNFDGAYAQRVVTIRNASAQHPGSRARATTRGTITLTGDGPSLALHGEWSDLRWPLPDADPPVKSAIGSYTLTGVKPYGFHPHGELTVPLVPQSMQFDALTVMFSDHIRIDSGTLDALEGRFTMHGAAAWSPQQTWSLAGNAANVNPVALRPDLPGAVSFDFNASGVRFAADGELDLALRGLRGKLRGNIAAGRGRAQRTGPVDEQTWRFQDVDLTFGTAHLTLDGSIAATRDLRFALTTSDLSLLDPGARGRIDARGELRGTDAAPIIKVTATGADFHYRNASLRTLDANIDVNMGPGGLTKGRLVAHDVGYGERRIDDMSFVLDGTAENHRASLVVQATRLGAVLDAQGAMNQGVWRGQITGVNIHDTTADLKLTLEAPAAVLLAQNEQSLANLCVRGNNARFCGNGKVSSEGWSGAMEATRLPLRTLTAGLSPEVDYDGTLDIRAQASAAQGQNWIGTLRADLQEAQLRHRLSNGREEKFAFGTGVVEVHATADTVDAEVGLDARASGRIAGRLHTQRIGSDWREFPIDGKLDLETDGLGLVDVYFAEIDRAAGRLTTRLNISGTLGNPQLQGELKLTGGEVDMYQVNLALRAVELDARFSANSLGFEGSAQAGDGTAKFNGDLQWREREPYGKIHLEGEDLRVVNVPEARIQASPNLDFNIAARRMVVTGEVKLPYARLEPADITNAVLPSADEVLVGATPIDPDKRMRVVSNITLTLGERATIDTFGLSGRLAGSINLRSSDESDITRGSGELNVVEGKYAAFGRKLDIEHGRLLFDNGPVADPGVDIRAVKKFPDVTAGVNVRGTLREPRMTFFSDPPVPQSQVVSLILGGSIDAAQNGNRSAARNDLLAQGGAIIAQQFGSRVGIEDVSIESDLTNETSLVLGKYLSPRLYVSYGISLAEAINTVKLRYTIGDHWTIRTESGRARSADLVYTIQK
ncbi:MAG: translocation/assembly module TamB domain-containing protein [Steroidobacteraceae bacterium]